MNHKFWNAGTGKPEDIIHAVKNAEAVTIPAGVPVVYVMNGTDDGLAVVLPSTAGSVKTAGLTAGITTKAIEPGRLADIQVYGFNRGTKVARATRAATTDAWPTMPAIVFGSPAGIDLAKNVIDPAGGQTMLKAGAIVVAENIGAGPTLPATAGTGTVYTQAIKTFLRFM
jgi:hypothetical protein